MAYFDILFFAIVAVVLILRLRTVLGRRNEDEPRRPNPFGIPPAGKEEEDEEFAVSPAHEMAIPEGRRQALPPPILAPDSLAGGIEQVRRLDPLFDEKQFLAGAKSAFSMIVSAFAQNDMGALRSLLGPEVYAAFGKAVEARMAAGVKLETGIHAIKEAELTRVKLAGDVARLTVRFVSEQSNAAYDKDGALTDGDPQRREEIEDIWVFARNLKQSDPAWLLVETGNQ
ncbi:MAG: Tim44/TimA family putative adaptor protein [Alphaproteobacteria bacterium]